jgi:transposase
MNNESFSESKEDKEEWANPLEVEEARLSISFYQQQILGRGRNDREPSDMRDVMAALMKDHVSKKTIERAYQITQAISDGKMEG